MCFWCHGWDCFCEMVWVTMVTVPSHLVQYTARTSWAQCRRYSTWAMCTVCPSCLIVLEWVEALYSEIAIVLGVPVWKVCVYMTDLSCVWHRCVYLVGVSIVLPRIKRPVLTFVLSSPITWPIQFASVAPVVLSSGVFALTIQERSNKCMIMTVKEHCPMGIIFSWVIAYTLV